MILKRNATMAKKQPPAPAKSPDPLLRITSLQHLAILDLYRKAPVKIESVNDEYAACFENTDQIAKLISDYEAGLLVAPLRDFAAAMTRVKKRFYASKKANE